MPLLASASPLLDSFFLSSPLLSYVWTAALQFAPLRASCQCQVCVRARCEAQKMVQAVLYALPRCSELRAILVQSACTCRGCGQSCDELGECEYPSGACAHRSTIRRIIFLRASLFSLPLSHSCTRDQRLSNFIRIHTLLPTLLCPGILEHVKISPQFAEARCRGICVQDCR